MAYAHPDYASLVAAISALGRPNPDKDEAMFIEDPVARRAAMVTILSFEMTIQLMIFNCDPTEQSVQHLASRHSSLYKEIQEAIHPTAAVAAPVPVAAVAAPPYNPGIRLKLPTITKCNLSSGNVELFLTSMITSCSGIAFDNDKAKAHYYVNNLVDSSKETLYAVHHPVDDDAWYTSVNVVAYLKQFISRNKGNQALVSIRTVHMVGNDLFPYYNSLTKLIADANSNANSALPAHLQVRYFIEGLNPDSIPTNLKLAVGSYLAENPTATLTDLYQHADHLMNTVLGPNYSNRRVTNQQSGGDFVTPKRRSGGAPRNQPGAKQPRHESNGRQPQQNRRQASGQPRPSPGASSSRKAHTGPACGRCGHTSHTTNTCEAMYHKDKYLLTSPTNHGGNKGKKPQTLALPAPPARDSSSWKSKPKVSAKALTLSATKGTVRQQPEQDQPKQPKPAIRRLQSIIVDPTPRCDTSLTRYGAESPLPSDDEEMGELEEPGNVLSASCYPTISDNQSPYRKAVISPVPRQRFTGHTGVLLAPRVPRKVTFEKPIVFTPPDNLEQLLDFQSESPPPSPESSLNEEQPAPSASLQTALESWALNQIGAVQERFEEVVSGPVRQILERTRIVRK
jgi:hypothetical protein